MFHSKGSPPAVPPNGANRGRYQNPQVDQLIDQAEHAATLAEQAKLYRQLQVLLHEDLPYVPLWHEHQTVAMRRQVQNYTVTADGNFDALKVVTW